MSVTLDEGMLKQIEDEVRNVRHGDVTVVDVQATRDWDSEGNDQVRLVVVLSDPEGSTWPKGELDVVMRRVRDVGLERGLDMWVSYTTPTPDFDDDDDQVRPERPVVRGA